MPSANDLKIRPATVRDYEAVARLNAEVQQLHAEALPHLFKPASPDSLTRQRFECLLSQERRHLLLAQADEPLGYLSAELVELPPTTRRYAQRTFRIHELSVASAHRRSGCGMALHRYAAKMAKSKGVTRMDLDTGWFNENARAFFRAAGFRELNVRLEFEDS